jgi:hypothetical protein
MGIRGVNSYLILPEFNSFLPLMNASLYILDSSKILINTWFKSFIELTLVYANKVHNKDMDKF